ncbi:MAG: site-2 protease family protein [Nitrospirota bacterium]
MTASAAQTLQLLAILALPILTAITFHEAAHGFVADRKGDDTARRLGRLTLNPVAHIDPFGTIALPLLLYFGPLLFFGQPGLVFGYAKPVPVNFMNLRRPKADMVWVAAAGPLTNLALAIACGLLLRTVDGMGGASAMAAEAAGPRAFSIVGPVSQILTYGVLINVWLMVFNLLPLPPLDGGRVLVGLLPHRSSEKVAALEPYGFLILMGLLFFEPFHLLQRAMFFLSSGMIQLILS